jgi:hypothetical protein
MASPESAAAERGAGPRYVLVVVCEIVVIAALWLLGRIFG